MGEIEFAAGEGIPRHGLTTYPGERVRVCKVHRDYLPSSILCRSLKIQLGTKTLGEGGTAQYSHYSHDNSRDGKLLCHWGLR